MPSVHYLLDHREDARRRGDRGVYRAISADLARRGYREDPESLVVWGQEDVTALSRVGLRSGLETTAVAAPEQALPVVKRGPGRPPKVRTET